MLNSMPSNTFGDLGLIIKGTCEALFVKCLRMRQELADKLDSLEMPDSVNSAFLITA